MLLAPSTITGAEGRKPRGCLVGNTTAELVPGDDEARAVVGAAFENVVRVIEAALARAQEAGEVTTNASPEAQARLLLILFQGSALVSRAYTDRQALITAIDAALDALRAR